MKNKYDLAIIGGGPAGMTAAIYAARYKLSTVIIGESFGGTANEAHWVENWPGEKSISGIDLMQKFKEHVDSFDVKSDSGTVKELSKDNGNFIINTGSDTYQSNSIILALGTKRRQLNVKGEQEFLGKGVSYCAHCDAFFFRNKTVAVVGGNDAAAQAALVLAEHAKKVHIVYRKECLRCEPVWHDRIKKTENIEIINNSEITEIHGENVVTHVTLSNGDTLNTDGVFIEIGSVPNYALVENLGVKTDEQGYIEVNTEQETNVPGVFAAGDLTRGSIDFKQIVVAAAHGATAAFSAFQYQKKNE